MRVPQQLHEQHTLLYILSWAYSVCVLFAQLFQQRGALSHVRFYVSFSPPLFTGSFAGRFENTNVNITVQRKRHLGAAIGSRKYTEKYIGDKVKTWTQEVLLLGEIATSQPHAPYSSLSTDSQVVGHTYPEPYLGLVTFFNP